MTLSNERIAGLFFTQLSQTSNVWACKCGKRRLKKQSGWTNLLSHIRSDHSEDLARAQADKSDGKQIGETVLASPKARSVHAWLEMVILTLQPLSFCENDVMCRHVRHEGISTKTLLKYMELLCKHVENKISKRLPAKFALVFDGWSHGDTHFVGIYATFMDEAKECFDKVLLALSPLEDETDLGAVEHKRMLEWVLSVFGKDLSNVVALIGDNVSTNKALALLVGCGFVGCASHRFNLAVKDLIGQEWALVEVVQKVMLKLRNLIPAAKLRRHTPLKPLLNNVTRWSSTHSMLRRYQQLRDFVPSIGDDGITILLPSNAEEKKIDGLVLILDELDSVTKRLQDEETTMADVRVLFDATIAKYPETLCRLGETAGIVLHPEFESALVKLQENRVVDLTNTEKVSVSGLKLMDSVNNTTADAETSFASRALKKRRINSSTHSAGYMDSRFITPTSNICERLMSTAGLCYGNDRRERLLPLHLEQQVFLKENCKFWNLMEVGKVIAKNHH